MDSTTLFRGMDRPALDAAYNNSGAVTDNPKWLDSWRSRSTEARKLPGVKLDIPYGSKERNKLDYFPSGKADAPVLVFIHGGYWVRNSRDMFSFLAVGPKAHGINYVSVGYTLAPQAKLPEIFSEIEASLSYLADQANELGFDKNAIYVSGWSAGGTLASMACEHPAVRGALPISGIFDLEPLSLNYINDALQFTEEDVRTRSPFRRLRAGLPAQRAVAGGNELPELQRQTRDYAQAGRALGLAMHDKIVPGHHHFSILDELANPDGTITQELMALIAETSDK